MMMTSSTPRRMNDSTRRHPRSLLRLALLVATTAVLVSVSSVDAFSPSTITTPSFLSSRTVIPFGSSRSSSSRSSSSIIASTSRLFSSTTTSPPPPTLTEPQQQQTEEQQQAEEEQQAAEAKSWTDDGFVFGLEGSGLDRPKGAGRVSQIVVEGDSLETKPYQQVLVATTLAAHAGLVAVSLASMLALHDGNVIMTAVQAVMLLLSSWILADFGSGVLHWSVDNYGNGRTPVMGSIIAAFQGHHSAPWTITERGFCNNVYKLCLPFGILPMALLTMLTGGPGPVTFFMSIFCTFEILSQEFHKWSHQLKSEVPGWVNALQDVGLTIGRKPHALHHIAPYEGNYCIISGICNPLLDKLGIFRRMEHLVYKWNGVESNAWKLDPELRQKTLSGDYSLPATTK